LAEWLAQNLIEPSVMYSVTEFYNDLPDQSQNTWDTAHGDLKWLEARELFSEADLENAADWLRRNGLVGGATVDQALGPVRLYLSNEGVRCAEDFASDTNAYMADQRRPAGMQRSPESDSPEIGQ